MAKDRKPATTAACEAALEATVEAGVAVYRKFLRKKLLDGRTGTHDMQLRINERGEPKLVVRPPFVPAELDD